jgi:predicted deacetylase
MQLRTTPRQFLVIVHDVAPQAFVPLQKIGDTLFPLLGTRVAAAIVPCWHGRQLTAYDTTFVQHVQTSYGELLLHGYSHHTNTSGPVALLTKQANEFTRLTAVTALARIRQGLAILAEHFEGNVAGFVPPAWQAGPITLFLLQQCGLAYQMGLSALTAIDTLPQPLAVVSWDCGRFAALGLIGEAVAALQYFLNPAAIPCIVIHPRDVERGFLVRAVHLIRHLLATGWQPVLPGQYIRHDDEGMMHEDSA